MIAYHYSTGSGAPLQHCPKCNADLTAPDSIGIGLSSGERYWLAASRLDSSGNLIDTLCKCVESGFHSNTSCANCGEMLINMPGVLENGVHFSSFDEAESDDFLRELAEVPTLAELGVELPQPTAMEYPCPKCGKVGKFLHVRSTALNSFYCPECGYQADDADGTDEEIRWLNGPPLEEWYTDG